MIVDRLGAEDRMLLDMSRRWPQDIGALVMLDGGPLFDGRGRFRLGAIREAIASRLDRVPRFRQVIRVGPRGGGGPFWVDDPSFDLARHVRELRLEPPVGEAGLLRAVEEVRALRFDRRSPLWGMWFLTGLPGRQVALFVKIHHSVADGLAAMTIVSAFLDPSATTADSPRRPWAPAPPPMPSALVADNLRRRVATLVRMAGVLVHPRRAIAGAIESMPALKEMLAEQPGTQTSIDRVVGDRRTMALVRGSYRSVRRIARSCDASVNDVLLSITAAGLRALLVARGEPVETVTLRTYVPVTLRRRLRGPQQGTQISQMVVPLWLGDAAPLERLRRIAAETRRRKPRRRPPVDAIFRGRFISMLLLKLVIAQRVNVTTASIPASQRQRWFAGARVVEVFPVLPLVANEPLGVGAVSYAGSFGIGITADRDAFPDIDILAAGVRDELAALACATEGQSPKPRAGSTAPIHPR